MNPKGLRLEQLSSGYRTPQKGATAPRRAHPAPQATGTAAVAITTDWRTHPQQRIRRVSRAREADALHRGRALLHMQARLADSQVQWLREVDEHIADLPLRADAKRHRRAIARMIGFHAEWRELVTRTLTWDAIAAQVGLTRRSVARHLHALHEDGFLGRVAAGRSAAAKQAAGWTGPEAAENDAPVYALTVPTGAEPVDSNVTPPTVSGYKESPARTGAREHPRGAATRPSDLEASAAGGGSNPVDPAHPHPPAWPSHVPAKRKDERVQAALALQARVPALRKISAKHVASVTRDFMLAGWTVSDLHHALDTLPDSRPQGHFVHGSWVPWSGADGIPAERFGHFLRFRLGPWRDAAGQPIESRSQQATRRDRARAAQRAAQQRSRRDRIAAQRARAADPGYQQAKSEALALIRSLSRNAARQ